MTARTRKERIASAAHRLREAALAYAKSNDDDMRAVALYSAAISYVSALDSRGAS